MLFKTCFSAVTASPGLFGRGVWPAACLLICLLAACDASSGSFTIPAAFPTATAERDATVQEEADEPTPPPPAPAAETPDAYWVGLETGFTEDGFPYMGSANAPIVVIEFSDFHCPYCRRHNLETLPRYVKEFVRTGQVQYVAKDLPLESLHPRAQCAHRAAWCAALQSTDAFWWMHHHLYVSQSQHARTDDGQAFYRMLAERHNADPAAVAPLDVEAFDACQADLHNEVSGRIAESVRQAREAGFNGTPTFVLFFREEPRRALPMPGALDFDNFAKVTRELAEFMANAEERAARAGELPYWISDEGLAPAYLWLPSDAAAGDAAVEGMTRAGDFFRGSPFADVVVFEFSDFQCPYCRKHSLESQPVLDASYVADGQVLWIYRHFPLDAHIYAPYAAEAAQCAGEQGRFWDMHEMLFADPDDWAHAEYPRALLQYGSRLADENRPLISLQVPQAYSTGEERPEGDAWLQEWPREAVPAFDRDAFAVCLVGDRYEAIIRQGMSDVSNIISGTPTFLIWHRTYGALAQPLVGSLELSVFTNVFDQILTQLAALEGEAN